MADWSYGKAGDEWVIEPGQVWRVGRHTFELAEIETGGTLARLRPPPLRAIPEFAYVDPPWGAAVMRAFQTKAGTPHGTWLSFLASFAVTLKEAVAEDVFVEMGARWDAELVGVMEGVGFEHRGVVPIVYYRTKPASLHHFAMPGRGLLGDVLQECTGLDDDTTPLVVAAALAKHVGQGAGLLDICAGRGGTALAAERAGLWSMNLELNPRRLAVAVDKMARLLQVAPSVDRA